MFRIVSIKKVTRKHTRTIEQNKWCNLYLISDNYERDTKFISYIAKKYFCEDWIKISHPGGDMRFLITFTDEENCNKCVKFLGRCHLYDKNLGNLKLNFIKIYQNYFGISFFVKNLQKKIIYDRI